MKASMVKKPYGMYDLLIGIACVVVVLINITPVRTYLNSRIFSIFTNSVNFVIAGCILYEGIKTGKKLVIVLGMAVFLLSIGMCFL